MRVIFAALAIVVLLSYFWLGVEGIPAISELSYWHSLSAQKDAAVLILALWLIIEGVLLQKLCRGIYSKEPGKESGKDEVTKLRSELDSAHRQIVTLEAKEETLQIALEEKDRRLEQAIVEKGAGNKVRPETINAEIVHFLSLLQEKGRFIDFLMEDITSYTDQQVGGAARVVHQGCSAILREFFSITPIHGGREGEAVTIQKQQNLRDYRLVGKVKGEPPFSGVVLHRGWRTTKVALPRVSEARVPDFNLIAPAEVEVR